MVILLLSEFIPLLIFFYLGASRYSSQWREGGRQGSEARPEEAVRHRSK